jgi:hypothetical protein
MTLTANTSFHLVTDQIFLTLFVPQRVISLKGNSDSAADQNLKGEDRGIFLRDDLNFKVENFIVRTLLNSCAI